MNQADDLQARLACYLALPEDDVEGRSQIAPSEEDLDELHALMVHSPEKRALYYQVSITRRADQIFHKEGQAQGWTVAQIRQQLARFETRNYEEQGESIQEVESFRFWPIARHLHRIRKKPKGGFIDEIEWDYLVPVDLEHVWQEGLSRGFEEESILLAQRYQDHEWVKEMSFCPPPGITFRIIFKAGNKQKEFLMPTALRYKNLLQKLLKDFAKKGYTLEESRYEKTSTTTLPQSPETSEIQLGLWEVIQKCDFQNVQSIPGYIKQGVGWKLLDAFKFASTTVGRNPQKKGTQRILRERLERRGGELDAPLRDNCEGTQKPLRDKLKDSSIIPMEEFIYQQEILLKLVPKLFQALQDPTDQEIFQEMLLHEVTQQKLAEKFGISQPAISKRMRRIRAAAHKVLIE